GLVGPAFGALAVARVVRFGRRIEIPYDPAVTRGVSAHVAVGSPGKDYAGNQGRRGRLRVGATLRPPGAICRRGGRVPERFARSDFHRGKTRFTRVRRAKGIGHGHVYGGRIGGGSPLNAAQRSAAAEFIFPDFLALFVRIEQKKNARFLARQYRLFAIRQTAQDGRTAEIEIRPGFFGTIAHTRLAAIHNEVVVG